MIRVPNLEQPALATPWPMLAAGLCPGTPDRSLREPSGRGPADRFCAWAGRSGRRYVFSVFALGSDAAAVPLVPKTIALMVRPPVAGPRRVLWAERIETEDDVAAIMRAAARQADRETAEIHLHALSIETEARRAAFVDLAFPAADLAEQPSGFRLAG